MDSAVPRHADARAIALYSYAFPRSLLSVSVLAKRYYRGERYIETDMDTGSSAAAASLCGRCRGLSRKIDVELGVVLQVQSRTWKSYYPKQQYSFLNTSNSGGISERLSELI